MNSKNLKKAYEYLISNNVAPKDIINSAFEKSEKLLFLSTKALSKPEIVTGEGGKVTNVSEIERRKEVKNIKNHLKEKLLIYNMIREVQQIV